MRSIKALRRVKDPEARLKAAHETSIEARQKVREARDERDIAAVAMREEPGRTQAEVLRALGISRSLYVRIEKRVKARGITLDIPDPLAAAKKAQRDMVKWHQVELDARAVRDEVVDDMLNGGLRRPNGARYRNADVARITGLTTARVAQMRVGER